MEFKKQTQFSLNVHSENGDQCRFLHKLKFIQVCLAVTLYKLTLIITICKG